VSENEYRSAMLGARWWCVNFNGINQFVHSITSKIKWKTVGGWRGEWVWYMLMMCLTQALGEALPSGKREDAEAPAPSHIAFCTPQPHLTLSSSLTSFTKVTHYAV